MRRGAIVRVVTIALLAAAVATAVALFIPWLPAQNSKEGERIDFVFWFTVAICIAVFAVVAAITVYSVAKFRVRPGRRLRRAADPRAHGDRDRLDGDPDDPRDRDRGRQRRRARGERKAEGRPRRRRGDRAPVRLDVRVPARTRRRGRRTSRSASSRRRRPTARSRARCGCRPAARSSCGCRALDVIHSFWVPEFRQKQDAVPGIVTQCRDHADEARRAHRRLHRALRARPRPHAGAGDRDEGGRVRPLALAAGARAAGRPGIR